MRNETEQALRAAAIAYQGTFADGCCSSTGHREGRALCRLRPVLEAVLVSEAATDPLDAPVGRVMPSTAAGQPGLRAFGPPGRRAAWLSGCRAVTSPSIRATGPPGGDSPSRQFKSSACAARLPAGRLPAGPTRTRLPAGPASGHSGLCARAGPTAYGGGFFVAADSQKSETRRSGRASRCPTAAAAGGGRGDKLTTSAKEGRASRARTSPRRVRRIGAAAVVQIRRASESHRPGGSAIGAALHACVE
jgi:hypothetical protein